MIEKTKELIITNRSASTVYYTVPNLRVNRTLAAGQSIRVTYDELEQLSFTPGGNRLLSEFLMITDPEKPGGISTVVEPEYYYTDKEVKELLLNGSTDELLDAIDFGPEGTKSLIKKWAVELPVNDVKKREIIKDKLYLDVTAVLINAAPEEEVTEKEEVTGRRVKKTGEGAAKSGRRSSAKAKAPEVTVE